MISNLKVESPQIKLIKLGFSFDGFSLVRLRPKLSFMINLFYRMLMYVMYVQATTIVSFGVGRHQTRHYAIMTLIFGVI